MTRVFNRASEKIKRKMLRAGMPRAEVILWSKLKGKGLKGYKFRRQYGVGKYAIDFYCPRVKLAIEVDGDSHYVDGAEYGDRERQSAIESLRISFLRFTNKEVERNVDGVVDKILGELP